MRGIFRAWAFCLVPLGPAAGGEEPAPAPMEGRAETGWPEFFRRLGESPRLLDDPGGARSFLEERGLTLSLYYNYYYGVNARGGASTKNAQKHSGSGDLLARWDLDAMGAPPGGEAFLHVKSNHGENINPDVGAFSAPIDDADFDEPIYIDQLWYQRAILGDFVRIRLGYLDQQAILDRNAFANSEDKQFMATALDNNMAVPLKIGFGAALFVKPAAWLDLVAAAADADNEIRRGGFDTAFDDLKSLISYFEAAFKYEARSRRGVLPGNCRLGTFYDPRRNAVFRSGGGPEFDRGHVGFFLSADQLLYRERPETTEGLGVFARYGYRDEKVNLFAHFWSAGLQYEGPFPGRAGDAIGLGVYQAVVSDRFRDRVDSGFKRETGYEIYYRIQVFSWLDITPDIQFIENPGGADRTRDALVLALRARVTF